MAFGAVLALATTPAMGGGVNVFGGGLALYKKHNNQRKVIGGVGLSGDTSCADHNIAWRVRNLLNLDFVPGESRVMRRVRTTWLWTASTATTMASPTDSNIRARSVA